MSHFYSYSSEDLVQFANQVKDVLMEATGYDLEDYIVNVGESSTYRRFAQKWLGFDPKNDETDKGLKIFVTKIALPPPKLKSVK